MGRALRDFAKRDDFVIATKFMPRTQEEIDAGVSGQRHIEKYLNQSLKKLGLDYVEGAAKAVDLELTQGEINYLEKLYVPHALVGVMAQNGKQKAGNVV